MEIAFWIIFFGLMVFACWVGWYLPRIKTEHLLQLQAMDKKLHDQIAARLKIEKDLQQLQAENDTLHKQLLQSKQPPL